MTSADITNHKVCVAGATGHLGLSVVERLLARNFSVVAVARNAASPNIQLLRRLGAEVEFVDGCKPEESYGKALSGAKTCISCMASRVGPASPFDFWAVDRDANIRLGLDALESGIRHHILVATFEGRESRNVSAFSAAKEEAVDTLRNECRRMGAELTVIRPNAYFKDLTDMAFNRVHAKGEHLVIGDGSCRINPISRDDVATFIVDCVEAKNSPGKDYFLGGPDVLTFMDIGILAAQVMGKENELKIRHVPIFCLRCIASILDLLGFFSRWARHKVAIVHWMVFVSTHDAVAPCCGMHHLRDEFEQKFKTSTTRSNDKPHNTRPGS